MQMEMEMEMHHDHASSILTDLHLELSSSNSKWILT